MNLKFLNLVKKIKSWRKFFLKFSHVVPHTKSWELKTISGSAELVITGTMSTLQNPNPNQSPYPNSNPNIAPSSSSSLTFDQVSKFFSLPLSEAADSLGTEFPFVCVFFPWDILSQFLESFCCVPFSSIWRELQA